MRLQTRVDGVYRTIGSIQGDPPELTRYYLLERRTIWKCRVYDVRGRAEFVYERWARERDRAEDERARRYRILFGDGSAIVVTAKLEWVRWRDSEVSWKPGKTWYYLFRIVGRKSVQSSETVLLHKTRQLKRREKKNFLSPR